jgi:D-alanyl-D-alanine carboxypeptidase
MRPLRRFALALCAAFIPAGAGAEPYMLVEPATGKVLAENEAFQRWYPASLAKLMTIYVVLRAIEAGEITLESPVKVSKKAAMEPPSKMHYGPGTVLTFANAVTILAVKSANDVAYAVAESLAGSQAAFRDRMNGEAARLGMTGTHFVNANGLHDTGQYTTARDLAVLASAIRREFPEHAHFFGYEGIAAGAESATNYNILIGRFDGADGMKTGFVCASGFNLIGSATRDGRTLIAVVLGAKSQQERAEIAADLMADGFAKAGTGTVALAELKPEGEGNGKARDMRSVVCTDKAQSERWDGREVEGKITFKSPHIKPMLREPKLVAITTGGAIGPVAPQAEALFRVEVPIPTPRPDRAAPQKQAAADTGSGGGAPEATAGGKLRPTLAAPLPDPAPRELN